MKRQFAAVGVFAFALFTAGCSQAPAPVAAAAPDTREADAKSIRDLEDSWNKDFEAKNAAALAAHYADDATLMSPGMPAAHGKADIEKVLKEMTGDPALALKFHASRVEVAKSGDMAYTEGAYEMAMTNPATKKPVHDTGSYVTTYRKTDGGWKAVSDIATSNAPPILK